jgi:uncharacterized membrane protein HdeD (DUF308 family)
MEYELARHWWVLVLRGVMAILFGLVAFFWPYIALLAVVYTFAAYALVDGAFALGALVSGQGRGPWWGLLLEGVAGVAFGVLTFAWPFAAAINLVVLLGLVAGWLIATGVFEVVAAIRLRREIRGEWLLALSGILSVLLGIGFALFPPAGLLVMALWMSAYAIVTGALLLAAGFRLRGLARRYAPPRREAVTVP